MSIIRSTFVEHELCFCARFVGGCREQGPFPALGPAAGSGVCVQAKESLGILGVLPYLLRPPALTVEQPCALTVTPVWGGGEQG